MRRDLTEFDNLGLLASEFVFEAIDLAIEYLEVGDGDDFSFGSLGTVLAGDGSSTLLRPDFGSMTFDEGAAALREELRMVDRDTCCVTFVRDGYYTMDGDRTEAVFVEGYELGRAAGVLLVQRYERHAGEIIRIGDPVLCDEPEPLVPQTLSRDAVIARIQRLAEQHMADQRR